MNYAAFGGSVPTAFDVDEETTYNNTEASMKFEVPDFNNPNGAYAGGAYFTNEPRDLSGYDALTFWIKATQPATIDVVGFGNDLGALKYLASVNGLQVNTNWRKYIIPLPDPSKLSAERGMFYYSEGPEDGKGYTFWIDEVKFEKLGTLAHQSATIFNGDEVVMSSENGETIQITGLTSAHNLPTGIDQSVNVAYSYFSFLSSNPAVASVSQEGLVTVHSEGTAQITAKLGSIDAAGSLTINSVGEAIKPASPPPSPTRSADKVISMYSNVYENVPVDTWNTRWQFSTAEESFVEIDGDDAIRYRSLNFVGIEFSSQPIDAAGMTHFHLDIWTPDPTNAPNNFKVLLVDFGANGLFGGDDDSSHELTFTAPTLTTQNWISLDIPLSNFSGLLNRSNLAQLVLSGTLPNLYLDNVYFYNDDTPPLLPTTAAPTPTHSASSVLSVFSDAYTNIAGTNLNPFWGQATVVTQEAIQGNNTLKYTGLNYQGIQLGSSQNVSSYTYLHIDFWTANSTLLNVFLISTGPVETAYSLPVPTSGWSSIDIPLSSFAPVDLTDVIQFKFEGNGTIYLDNLYFRN
ncbi:MAG: Ig-like domain-containing protein [Sphingobacteriales bacterium]|nr:MAG: Ig-like domain-containing protein [Sphingobacteriales bacterium]